MQDVVEESFSSNLESPGAPRIPPGALGSRRSGTKCGPKLLKMGATAATSATAATAATASTAAMGTNEYMGINFLQF